MTYTDYCFCIGKSSFSSYVKVLLNASRNYHLGLQEVSVRSPYFLGYDET